MTASPRLQLFALAYDLANFLRQLVLPKPIRCWTLTPLREKPIKFGAKVVRHATSVVFRPGKPPSRGRCSRRCCAGSVGCDWHVRRGEACRPLRNDPKGVRRASAVRRVKVSAVSEAADGPGASLPPSAGRRSIVRAEKIVAGGRSRR
jgi:hypothetical protein